MLGLPIIESLEDFSRISHLSKGLLYFYSKFSDKNYTSYCIPKKNGGSRQIAQPSKKLKALQSWILRNILDRLEVSPASKGFKKGQSIVDNVRPHIGAKAVLSLDLENFFPSITADQVYTIFYAIGYNKHIALIFTSLCTFNNRLPQGSPCSPSLANLISMKLDNRIQGYVGKRGITYTRYADDLTFSGANPQKLLYIYKTVEIIIKAERFTINKNKTRIMGLGHRKKITGLVVNENKFGIGRGGYRLMRAKVFDLTRKEKSQIEGSVVEHIKGWMAFIKSVDKSRYSRIEQYVVGLQEKHPNSGVMRLNKN